MKKISFNAVAVAVGALFASSAFATVDLDAAASATNPTKLASELSYATAGTPLTGVNAVTSKLGFGVSDGQTRFIRIDLTGARLDVAAAGANVGGLALSSSTVASGGQIDDTFVIYQITATGATNTAILPVTITLPTLDVTNANASPIGVTYALFETGTAAASNSGALYSKSGTLATFASGISFTLTPATSTATVANDYKSFGGNTALQQLGTFSYGPAANVFNAAGAAVTLANLVTTADVIFRGDFSAAPGVSTGLFSGAACGTALTLDTGKTNAPFAVNTTTNTNTPLCYTVDGTTQIVAQSVTAELDVKTKPASSSLADIAAATVGTIVRDGTELQAPWFTTFTGYQSRFVINSTYSKDATYTAKVITENGNTCTTGAGVSGTVPAGKQVQVSAASICSALSAGQRAAVIFTIAAPSSTMQGTYVVTAPDGTNSFGVMIRPGSN